VKSLSDVVGCFGVFVFLVLDVEQVGLDGLVSLGGFVGSSGEALGGSGSCLVSGGSDLLGVGVVVSDGGFEVVLGQTGGGGECASRQNGSKSSVFFVELGSGCSQLNFSQSGGSNERSNEIVLTNSECSLVDLLLVGGLLYLQGLGSSSSRGSMCTVSHDKKITSIGSSEKLEHSVVDHSFVLGDDGSSSGRDGSSPSGVLGVTVLVE